MGDRSNLFFRAAKGGIGVYAHWSGLDMATAAMAVLKNDAFQQRVGDTHYALRIGVQTALEVLGADSKADIGFGLWTPETGADDNGYNYIVIDVNDGSLFVAQDWAKPKPSEKVAKPTVSLLRKKMVGK